MKPQKIYALESENMTGLGGPMGSERTWLNWTKHYWTPADAKKAAELDLARTLVKREPAKIRWSREGKGWTSGDLGHVMYNIREVVVL